MENKSNLVKAVINVMKSVKGIDKSMTVGNGSNSYKGVPDQEVKKIIGDAMEKNGLAIIPIGVEPITKIERWEEVYNGQPKQRQSIFTEVKTTYLLLHESGENQIVCGYGHGVDSQDKGAGKATTYALKYALLYMFMVPTGKIDDTDVEHSDTKLVPQKNTSEPIKKEAPKQDPKFIQDPIEKIKATKNKQELVALYNSMPPSQQKAEHIINAFKNKQETFKNK